MTIGQVVMHRYGEFKFGTVVDTYSQYIEVEFLRDGVLHKKTLLHKSVLPM